MLLCSQLKLSERRSVPKLKNCNISGGTIVVRPCTQRNITEAPQKMSNVHHVTEKRLPELRVISLNLDDHQPISSNDRKLKRAPYRMPLFCTHFKSLRKNYERNKKDLDENFIVRGFEVGSGHHLPSTLSNTTNTDDDYSDPDEDDLNFLRNGIQIQLTDCCQCVCDLFNSNFPISQHDYNNDLSFVTIEKSTNSLRPYRPTDVVSVPSKETQSHGLLDPDILKVIRVTMNTKNLIDYK